MFLDKKTIPTIQVKSPKNELKDANTAIKIATKNQILEIFSLVKIAIVKIVKNKVPIHIRPTLAIVEPKNILGLKINAEIGIINQVSLESVTASVRQ